VCLRVCAVPGRTRAVLSSTATQVGREGWRAGGGNFVEKGDY